MRGRSKRQSIRDLYQDEPWCAFCLEYLPIEEARACHIVPTPLRRENWTARTSSDFPDRATIDLVHDLSDAFVACCATCEKKENILDKRWIEAARPRRIIIMDSTGTDEFAAVAIRRGERKAYYLLAVYDLLRRCKYATQVRVECYGREPRRDIVHGFGIGSLERRIRRREVKHALHCLMGVRRYDIYPTTQSVVFRDGWLRRSPCPYSARVAASWLKFYVRKPAFESWQPLKDEMLRYFGSRFDAQQFKSNKNRPEWRARVTSIEDVEFLFSICPGAPYPLQPDPQRG